MFRNASTLLICLLLLVLSSAAAVAQRQQGTACPDCRSEFFFPQIFNVDENNTSAIYVQNIADTGTVAVRIRYFDKNGMDVGGDMAELGPQTSGRFNNFPMGFEGYAHVRCLDVECSATATWDFALEGQDPVAVGIAPVDASAGATRWAAPIPNLPMGATFGIAVQNASDSGTTCSAFYYSRDGMQIAMDGFPSNAIPPRGQFAFLSTSFPANVEPDFVNEDGSVDASILMNCFNEVIPVILIQDPTNGFPTPIEMFARPEIEEPQ